MKAILKFISMRCPQEKLVWWDSQHIGACGCWIISLAIGDPRCLWKRKRGQGWVVERFATSPRSWTERCRVNHKWFLFRLVESDSDFYPKTRWQQCTLYFYRNIFRHVPKAKLKEVKIMLKATHASEDLEPGRDKVSAVLKNSGRSAFNKLLSMLGKRLRIQLPIINPYIN